MRVAVLLGMLCLFGASASPAAAQDTYLLVITGIEGDAAYGDQFHKWASALIDAAKNKGGIPESNITYLADKPDRDPSRIRGRSTRERVTSAFADLATRTQQNDEVVIILIGHGSFDGRQATFNLPGPDLTAADYAALVDKIHSTRIVFVNTASSSGEFIKALAGPGRTIVTATRTGGERNETRFPAFFVEALTGDAADRDRNGRVSMQEAFDYAQTKVQQAFEKEGYVPTEHATLSDGGTGAAAMLFLDSERARAAAVGRVADPALRTALEEQRALEDQITGLKLRKSTMPPDEYERELERLLTALAQKTRVVRQLEGGK